MRHSVALAGHTASELVDHLLRPDRQEDLCFAMWMPSTGLERLTAILQDPILPLEDERRVHGNASFEAAYLLRAAQEAAREGKGLAFMHSHPVGTGWQALNEPDRVAEARIANLSRELTGLPLVGLTLAGDRCWSARIWHGVGREVVPRPSESVRVIGDVLSVTFNEAISPVPPVSKEQVRTVHTWGEETQGTIARLRVAVAGTGSVGMVIADVLARTGIESIGIFDFDTVEKHNLDRLRGAGSLDARLARSKAHLAERLLADGSTAATPNHQIHELSICEPEGFERLLDFDLIFSCVDRPWPRHVLNRMAYADLIPVVEGGLSAFRNSDGGLRNAYWRSTVVRPGRPCLACLGQYDLALVQVERDGSLEDPSYMANLPPDSPLKRRENVAAFSTSVASSLLEQFVSYVASPSGMGDPGPLRYSARDHSVELDSTDCADDCQFQESIGCGDTRLDPTSRHLAAEGARRERAEAPVSVRLARWMDDQLLHLRRALHHVLGDASDAGSR